MKSIYLNFDRMNEWWKLILQKDAKILADKRAPLININDYLLYFKMPPISSLKSYISIVSHINSLQPSFQNLREDILLTLRHNIYAKKDFDIVTLWAEKLMRFCEIRYSILRKRSIEKWGNTTVARLNMLHLSAFLLDFCVYTKDLRFLNTVLKLIDLRWIVNKRTIRRDLSKEKEDILCALFQFRIILITEYAINQLHKGNML